MNTIYRIVWNASTGSWVVASEMAKGRKKASAPARTLLATALAAGSLGISGIVMAGSLDGGSSSTSLTIAYGPGASAPGGGGASAIGASSTATELDATAVGFETRATAVNAIALGNQVEAAAMGSIAIQGNGGLSVAVDSTSSDGIAIGTASKVIGSPDGIALGRNAHIGTGSMQSVAIGTGATVTAATNSVALGAASTASRTNTVSVGNATTQRQIVNMSAGVADTDSVNVSQLKPVVTALGGGAAFDATTGAVTGPSYALTNANTINGTTGPATDVGAGFVKVDDALGQLRTIASAGWNLSADGGATSQNIAPGGSANFAAGSNATVSRTGNTMTYGVVANWARRSTR